MGMLAKIGPMQLRDGHRGDRQRLLALQKQFGPAAAGPNCSSPEIVNQQNGGNRAPARKSIAILRLTKLGQFPMKTPGQICVELNTAMKMTNG